MKEKRTRRRRRWPFITGGVLVAIVILLLFLPMLAAHLVVPGVIRSNLESRVQGQVVVSGVHLSWFGSQGVEQLAVTSTDGATTLDVSATAERSLLGLLFGCVGVGIKSETSV